MKAVQLQGVERLSPIRVSSGGDKECSHKPEFYRIAALLRVITLPRFFRLPDVILAPQPDIATREVREGTEEKNRARRLPPSPRFFVDG